MSGHVAYFTVFRSGISGTRVPSCSPNSAIFGYIIRPSGRRLYPYLRGRRTLYPTVPNCFEPYKTIGSGLERRAVVDRALESRVWSWEGR